MYIFCKRDVAVCCCWKKSFNNYFSNLLFVEINLVSDNVVCYNFIRIFLLWMDFMEEHIKIISERFAKDSLMALATVDEKGTPWCRTIDAIFIEDSFYTITYALSNKIKHIEKNPQVAISGDWFSCHGIGQNIGYIKSPENEKIANALRTAFASWYDNGHTNEDDPNTIILKIKLTGGTLFSNGKRFDF